MFRKTLAAVLLFSAAARPQQYRAFWADAFHYGFKSPAEVDRMVEEVAAARGNAIFAEVRLRGGSYFLNSIEPPVEDATWSRSFDALQYLIEKAHARGIEVHAWYPITSIWDRSQRPQDPRHAFNLHGPHTTGDDMWMTVTAGGRVSTTRFDPGHPGALGYMAEVALDPARKYDIDGIHLDYIRYPEDDDYGYNPRSVARFERLQNRVGPPQPSDPRWSDFRRQQVTQLVRQIYLKAQEIRGSLKVSAALISWGDGPASDVAFMRTDAYRRVFQDWRAWLEEGILDIGMPMNYFDNARNSAFLDRWLEFEKNRQYRRAVMPGLGVYLNTIPDSLSQMQRVLGPSSSDARAAGIAFYSYASTNKLDTRGLPVTPNADFYAAVRETLGADAAPPVLSWKAAPDRGHILGTLTVDGGPPWLRDGAGVRIESDTGRAFAAETTVDGTGFFGAVDLVPDRYRIRVHRNGTELFRTVAQDVAAGAAVRFDIFLKDRDFASALPRIRSARTARAAPGDLVTIEGASFSREFVVASAVPLPLELERTQILVNGQPAALQYVSPERIEFQIPFAAASEWNILVRADGLESAPFRLTSVSANPAVVGVRRVGARHAEIYATGLGLVSSPPAAGAGGNPEEPYHRTLGRVRAFLGQTELTVLYAGLAPYQPYRYQVNVELPADIGSGPLSGLRLTVE